MEYLVSGARIGIFVGVSCFFGLSRFVLMPLKGHLFSDIAFFIWERLIIAGKNRVGQIIIKEPAGM